MKISRLMEASMILAVAIATGCSSNDAANDGGTSDGSVADNGSGGGADSSSGGSGSSSGGSSGSGSSSGAGTSDGGGRADSGTSDGSGADARANDAGAMCGPFANGAGSPGDGGGQPPSTMMTFFVSSQKNMTGNLGGVMGADMRCQTLAAAVGLGSKTWHAYLSLEHDASNGNGPTNARDRIGAGPWFNAQGVMLAANVTALHMRTGDPAVFLDEHANMINGQWTGSPPPIEHDILTGSNADGTLAPGKTCLDWTSTLAAADAGVPDGGELLVARVGHTDGFGPMCSTATTPNNLTSWNSAHDNAGCSDTAPRGGAGRIYCFAIN
jgi:hypothetical protein